MAEEFYKKWAEILAHTWTDPSYRATVESDPAAALETVGVLIPKGVQVTVKPMTSRPESDTVLVLPFPEKPASVAHDQPGPMAMADVESIMAASSSSSSSAISCCCP